MSAATEERVVSVLPFGIEADHPRNDDLRLKCIAGARLRSAIDGSKPYINTRTGEAHLPFGQAHGLAAFPKTPGMQLHVNPAECTYVILDPLEGDEVLLERISKWLRNRDGIRNDAKIKGVPAQKGKLDAHQMKSLCREMLDLVEAGEAKRCKGPLPSREDVDELPGYYLLNPGIQTMTSQPRYEKDFDDWVQRLHSIGG